MTSIDKDLSTPPPWFSDALQTPAVTQCFDVAGVPIALRSWGEHDASSGVVLVHGTAASARWWDHIGPQLAEGRRVVAIDLSGHGDSGHRTSYSQQQWADELSAVVLQHLPPCPIVIAHSMGGKVAYRAATTGLADHVRGIIFLDSNFGGPLVKESAEWVMSLSDKPLKVYPDLRAVVDGFRPIRSDHLLPRHFAEYIGPASANSVDGGWSWKFDPRVFVGSAGDPPPVTPLTCRVAIIRAERNSVLSRTAANALADRLGLADGYETLFGSGHHMMFDAPESLVARLRGLLVDWTRPAT